MRSPRARCLVGQRIQKEITMGPHAFAQSGRQSNYKAECVVQWGVVPGGYNCAREPGVDRALGVRLLNYCMHLPPQSRIYAVTALASR